MACRDVAQSVSTSMRAVATGTRARGGGSVPVEVLDGWAAQLESAATGAQVLSPFSPFWSSSPIYGFLPTPTVRVFGDRRWVIRR